jgi:[ribosomal protein S18]-alanine N-acetyltransferase
MLGSRIAIRPASSPDDREWCAQLMACSEPWVTLGRTLDASRRLLEDPSREVFVATADDELRGFLILTLAGAFPGYIQTICVAPDQRRSGIGSQLLAFAEDQIFRTSPNVFLCVSSFNHDARRLYERRGYVLVGELTEYLVKGHSELLFRKTRGPWSEFASRRS